MKISHLGKTGRIVTDEGQEAAFDPFLQYPLENVVWQKYGCEVLLVCLASFEAIMLEEGDELEVTFDVRHHPYNPGTTFAFLTSKGGNERKWWEWETFAGEDVTGYYTLQAGPVSLSGDRPWPFLSQVVKIDYDKEGSSQRGVWYQQDLAIRPFWMGVAVGLEKLHEEELLTKAGIDLGRRLNRNHLPFGEAVGCVAKEGWGWKSRVISAATPRDVFTPCSFYRVD